MVLLALNLSPVGAQTSSLVCPSPNLAEDFIVNASALLECIEGWKARGVQVLPDFNRDGVMDASDLFVFQDHWHEVTGVACPRSFAIVSQADVDALAGCTVIDGDLVIGSSDGNFDLTPLRSLVHITGDFGIIDNSVLTSLDGLQGLTTVGGSLAIERTGLLNDISAQEHLTRVGGSAIRDNSSLDCSPFDLGFFPVDVYCQKDLQRGPNLLCGSNPSHQVISKGRSSNSYGLPLDTESVLFCGKRL
jgi:receptor L domain-containing protein